MTGHEFEEEAQRFVKSRFHLNDVPLHIDTNFIPVNQRCSMNRRFICTLGAFPYGLPCILGSKLPTDDGCLENRRTFKELYHGGYKIAHQCLLRSVALQMQLHPRGRYPCG